MSRGGRECEKIAEASQSFLTQLGGRVPSARRLPPSRRRKRVPICSRRSLAATGVLTGKSEVRTLNAELKASPPDSAFSVLTSDFSPFAGGRE